ncbi:MAG: iron export ABC transporter permease subunit FetB [Gammaproteobacteria bacterium]|nr:iron export ABC transporter permease subunit FetB [Gammaproteobacteria bacterium]MDH5653987.1 iron export ABC transporter permease subunit FetB [Gammaproteobacteria bacterium]
MNVIPLSALDLMAAAGLVILLAVLSMVLQLGLGKRILIAAFRTTVQLLLIGYVLKTLFERAQLVWVLLLAMIMLSVAGYEVMARQKRSFSGLWGYGLGTLSMFISSFTIALFVLLAVINVDPWYTPQYAIPLLGMLLGNTMTGVALSLDRLTQGAWEKRGMIEARLILGEDWRTAIGEIVREAIRVGLMPMINAMAAAGIVSLPGMMTGQILGGSPPLEAVKYQILIMFMIAAGTGFAGMGATWLGARHLFDDRQRLRLDRLREQ